MFARSVTIHLKSNSVSEFNSTMEKDILPLLRKQKGFRDEISLVATNGTQGVGNQFMGPERRRGSLQPHNLSRGAEASGKSK